MKKILSVLIVVLFGVTAVYSQSTVTVHAYANINTKSKDNLGGGTVQAHTASRDWKGAEKWDQPGDISTHSKSKGSEAKGGIFGTEYKVIYSADAYPDNGYYFSHWLDDNGNTLTGKGDKKNGIENITHSTWGTAATVHVYAIFKPVTITSVTINGESTTSATIHSTDKGGHADATVVFTVTGADNLNDFLNNGATLVNSDSRFKIQDQSISYDSETNIGTVTVVVRFIDDDRHILEGTLPQAELTLTSAGGENSGTATITASSDLRPLFAVEDCDLTPVSPVEEGNTVTATVVATPDPNYPKVNNAGTWTAYFSDEAEADKFGYSIESVTKNNVVVSFTPTAFSMNQANVATELCIKCVYTDSKPESLEEIRCITLSADAGKVITINGLSDAVMDFGIVDFTETNSPITIEYPIFSTLDASVFNVTEEGFDDTYISRAITFTGAGATTDKVSVTVNSTRAIGDYTASLKYDENVATGAISASMQVKVSMKLAKPVVTPEVVGTAVTLNWNPVYGATSYIVKSEDVTIAEVTETTYTVNAIGGAALVNGTQYPFTVTAVYSSNTLGNRESDVVYATPGIPTEIRNDNVDNIEIFTGTEAYIASDSKYGTFPYALHRKIELNVFGTDGSALFDYLYIFGVTTNEEGGTEINNTVTSTTTPCNAKTPCYVYTKSDNKYVFSTEFDAVQNRFDHKTKMNGKKLYFTGYCPFANIGTEVKHEGWMYFQGGNTSVDLYLDSCQIYGRCRSSDGSQSTSGFPYNEVLISANVWDVLAGNENINYMSGFSSIFVFNSTNANYSTPYRPAIHIRGRNHLRGQLGYINEVFAYVLGTKISMETLLGKALTSISTCSAPITIKPDAESGYTHLTMDDIWPNGSSASKPTNGYLKLDTYLLGGASRVPSIDMGSEFSSLTINGGQYNLHNSAAPDGEYTNNMAISHRKYYKEAEALGQHVKVSLYGFGGDQATNTVIINSGTFTMEKNMYGDLGGSYYIDQDNYLDLRLPAGKGASQINGGTFNGISNVVFCSEVASSGGSPINGYGDWLCPQDVVVEDEKTSYGSNTFIIPEPYDEYDDPMVVYNLEGNLIAVEGGNKYGGQSANAYTKDERSVVTLLLPGTVCEDDPGSCTDCKKLEEALYRNWATTIPELAVKITNIDATIGGDAEVPYNVEGASTLAYMVNQMLYMDLAGMEGYSLDNGELALKLLNEDKPRGNFTNEKEYKILKHLNIVKVVDADYWYTFVAPFDIDVVSVLEVDEAVVSAKPTKAEAIQAQMEANSQLMLDTYNFYLPNSEGRSSSYTFPEIIAFEEHATIPLKHYNGTTEKDNNYGENIFNANYYLYELTNKEFATDGTGAQLDIEWKPVKRDVGEPLMKQGEVYAIQFPYCPMCNDRDTRTDYDYWSKKFILFHGTGPQTVCGTTAQSTILASTLSSSGTATLTGNYTLRDMTLPANTGYVHNTANDYFELKTSAYTVRPTEGYMLYNPSTSSLPARISRSGQIEYGSSETSDIEGVPTIADQQSLMLFDAFDGFELLSLREQVVAVYNLQGNIIFRQLMAEGEQVHVPATPGVYVVRGEQETIKLMVD